MNQPDLTEIIHHLLKDEITNMSIIGFIDENTVTEVLRDGESVLIKGKSDEEWIYIFSKDEKELSKIPTSGGFVTISNHPFGALDGLLLLYVVSKVRMDFKVMANFLLQKIEPLSNSFIAVNPFENQQELASSLTGTKGALQQLKDGGGLGVFPAGEVSSFQTSQRQIADKQWKNSILKLISKAEVPIVPIYFEGSNSLLFQLLGIIHPSLRTIALPSEMLKKRHTKIKIRIGRPVPLEDQKNWDDLTQFGRFLRAKTYSLDSSIQVKSFFKNSFTSGDSLLRKKTDKILPIAPPLETHDLVEEIKSIEDLKINTQAEFSLYLSPSERIPKLLNEIGRQRELSFRAVGEGTNKAIDLDEYDLYYHHLFLWDHNQNKLVGAYRLGKGNDIYNAYGKKGFYISSLFKIKKDFSPILKQAIEMGRSFVVKEYQQKRLPLFLLWKGIMYFVLNNKEYRYLIGPVSISGSYSKLSRMIMVQFIKKFYFNNELAKWVSPRNKFKINFKKVEGDSLIESAKDNLKKVDQIIADIEPNHAPLPVLIKKYIRQNAKIICFNVDPKFNDALDGLMLLDLEDLPQDSIEELKKDML